MDHELRRHLYLFLEHALTYPSPGFAGRLRDRLGETRLETWGDDSLALAPLLQDIRDLGDVPLEQLQGEYTGLFVNNPPRLPCPPYESAYREGRLLGSAAAEVAETYRRWGLATNGDMADHVSTELEFMAFLAGLPQEEQVREAQKRFLRDHLLTWLPHFAADVQQQAHVPFYRTLGRLLTDLLEQEKQNWELPATQAS